MTDSLPASSPTSATALVKEFRCSFGHCTKSFSRAEHLHRHALNHNDGNGTTCARCNAVFKRKDLLDRHMQRHKEKDDEAGGEGMGKLLTRKRLWRDSNGAIIADRRPEHEKKRKRASMTSQDTNSPSRQSRPLESNTPPTNDARAPLSPPTSDPTGSEANGNARNAVSVSADDQWPAHMDDTILPLEDTVMDSFDFLCNASWGTQPLQDSQGGDADLPYDDIFMPDTEAASFNMPFTTMQYYNWLFGNDPWQTAGYDPMGPSAHSQSARPAPHVSNIGSLLTGYDDSHRAGLPPQHDIPHRTALPNWSSSDYSSSSADRHDNAVSKSAELLLMLQSGQSHPPPYTSDIRSSISDESIAQSHGLGSMNNQYLPTPISNRSQDATMDHGQPRRTRKLPIIDETAREAVLSLIIQAHPKSSDGIDITTDHPLLTMDSLQQWSDLFFGHFNVSYPLFHQATFDPSQTEPLLLTAVLLLGATYSSKDDHLFSICIHNVMRTQIFGSVAFTTRPTLWILQTVLLVECFGKSRAGQLQHDMSHLFHGLLINLIRRSDCQSARCRAFNDGDVDPHTKWIAEVEAEQKRRLALLCFMWDTQHAVLFSQSLCMNAAELKLSLPWDIALWEADTVEEWQAASLKAPSPPLYLSVLKSYINPGPNSRTPKLNGLSRVLMLHGLMSVAWDLDRRDQTSLGIAITGASDSWQSRIARSYDTWKSDFDNYTKESLILLEGSPERDEFQKFCTANLAIYHAAHIILNVEIIDLQIYAGASHIIGRPVTRADRDRSRQRIESWAKQGSTSAAKAGSHAARILRDGIRKLKHWDVDDVFHYPWCLYLASLTCWAFQVASKAGLGSENGEQGDNSDDDDAEWDSKAEMNALVSAMTRSNLEDLWRVAGKYRTSDLPRVMAKHLASTRWAVVQEAMIVLRGLIGKDKS
ncbi:Nicotinate catabolism cluster-specific transcription factor [Hyphodiscus hymeniophilus]|uniref:Nicotinate catabolism cluster-specific transcription factor n=1 Tax=Hyphodiscus hymeniophilus TaxID=353542 RepID=A0A9P6VPE1_9HELO|nr:Nicotinate catabolism cluster-specific transcription factor [Hyphodiscus hymeniophilus]